MITDKFIIRKADNILLKNEIAIFHPMYFKPSKNISAISIENTKIQVLSEDRYKLLNYVCHKIDHQIKKIKVIICLYQQPDTKFIKYKGGWGILKSHFIDVDKIAEKKEFVLERNKGLDFILEGEVNIKDDSILKKILDVTNVIYFSIEGKQSIYPKIESPDDWINYMLDIGGSVLFFLGLGLETACEIVVMKKSKDILQLLE
ncbi:TPA: hypothetical protein PWU90_002096 [Mannheimia haemolytica]|uniref:hypothetical protein n=1 Tax=Mannheimia haemolytica TaxID=75985 RepID=UPI0025A08D53|nr:hypothetical protein [Mannheimia haemolytica]HDL1113861.1 hypothetical protein [Mannheimia haemolytica]HDL1116313.1 hypothetical protein [Mannheimia haemolytica]HDL1124446.1 hypothetical protein [Mannheimia haemolytica]HDL1127049.1 hypothetical protein [Mannheimia haemolytica]HDL1129486.1 hypothetical protein [Mannheimia haemolytica]